MEQDAGHRKAYLEDIEHTEILLRNFIAERLAADCERRIGDEAWFDHPELYNLNDKFDGAVDQAKRRISHSRKPIGYDAVIAALSFDTWRYLLVKRLEPTVWRALRDKRNGGMPAFPERNRAAFEEQVVIVYSLRNRCSHQEHLVLEDYAAESVMLDRYSKAIALVAARIDPGAAEWITRVSRVDGLRERRPL